MMELKIKNTPVYHYGTLDSTNDEAKRLFSGKSFVVLADEQTAGKGRNGKSFYSPENVGLYMSAVLCRPFPFPTERLPLLTPYAAVCITDAIEELTGIKTEIKWVNDVLYNGKKICGILTEIIGDERNETAGIIVGIGINLRERTFPTELQKIAGFLPCERAVEARLAERIIDKLMVFDGNGDFLPRYRERSAVLGRAVRVIKSTHSYNATAIDVDALGGLVIRTSDGATEVLRGGEISLSLT